MGLFEKRRFRNLLIYINDFDINNPKTWKDMDPKQTTAAELFKKFDLDDHVQDFTGHALALYRSDE